MALTLRTARRMTALVAFAALAAFDAAANHFILPCGDVCADPRWVLTGSLNTARWNHTATLLRNGKVLVAGGSDDNGAVLASVELYDPATETWSIAGSMTAPRAGHLAFLLPTGAVLVIGGEQSCCLNNVTAEAYDPDTGSWTPAGGPGPRFGLFGATVLPSDKVFLTGVMNYYTTASWWYDPLQQTWTQAQRDPVYRQLADTALLPGGAILVTGGTNDADEVRIVPGAELYDPATGAWTVTGSPSVLRESGTHTLLPNGSVLAAGGFSWVTQGDQYSGWTTYSVPLRSSESYDPDATWLPVGDLNDARSSHTATMMPDGRVLIAGGEGLQDLAPGTYSALKSAELYDPTVAAWSYTSSLSVARRGHTATLLDDGSVLVVGGVGGDSSSGYTLLGSAEIYVPGGSAQLTPH